MKNANKISCPICSIETDFGVKFCRICGWVFEYYASEVSDECQKDYAVRLDMAKKVWHESNQAQNRISELENHNIANQLALEQLSKEQVHIQQMHVQIENLKKENQRLSCIVDSIALYFTIKIGDYIQFGHYRGEPILWRVIHKDDDGDILLFSEYIISFKAFDAAESGKLMSGSSYRKHLGSNYWGNSNIREWLNSYKEVVQYSTQPPVTEAVWGNTYAHEPGFLYNFTENEIKLIKPIARKIITAEQDSEYRTGGKECYQFGSYIESIGNAVSNYDKSYYTIVTDSVFLLSPINIKEYIYDRGWECKARATKETLKALGMEESNNFLGYWLCCPLAINPYSVLYIEAANNNLRESKVNSNEACCSTGVRPALYLNLSSVTSKPNGRGKIDDPYVITS